MKYVFFGTPRFAAIVLEKLIEGDLAPIAIVCNPDKPVGRKKIVTPPDTKQVILNSTLAGKIKILQPKKIDSDFLEELKSLNADFFVLAAYGKILPKSLLDIPRLGVIGTHGSLLPELRGASPIQNAIIQGFTKTGITLYLMDDKVDHGPILAKSEEIEVGYKNYLQLQDEIAKSAGNLLLRTLPRFFKGEITPESQQGEEVTTRIFKTEDAYIKPEDLVSAESGDNPEMAIKVLRKILGMNPEPGTYTIRDNKRIKLLEAKIVDSRLKLTTIQEEGKRPHFLT